MVVGGRRPAGPGRLRKVARLIILGVGAVIFLFPFYYMVVGSLQTSPGTSIAGAFPNPADLSFVNYRLINERIHIRRALLNSGIFTAGVVLSTVVVGSLAGYALAQLRFRGRSALFAVMLVVQMLPFHLLMIPLYVMVVRDYGLGDTYLGMILPGAVNATAVFIFRQFFLSLPPDVFESARIDGANELRVLWHVALPLIRPALLTVVLVTFIGPWNDFLWPFLVTKESDMQPMAVALANFINAQAGASANPFGAILAGAVILALPVVLLFVLFQRHFTAIHLGSGSKG
jgi:multiple sugar transport system permease protein